MEEQVDGNQYKVVINDEEQYSIWLADRANPAGWHDVGKSGSKDECLDHIEVIWTDMRPLSVRKHLIAMQNAAAATAPDAGSAGRNAG